MELEECAYHLNLMLFDQYMEHCSILSHEIVKCLLRNHLIYLEKTV